MEIIYKKIDEIIPYNNNPRFNDNAVEYVAKSIKEFGFKVPCIIDTGGVLITGHTRLKAAKELGMEEIPCIIADDLTEEQINAFRLVDNKVSEIAEWDYSLLDEEIEKLKDLDIDLEQFGFNDFNLDMYKDDNDDEENNEINKKLLKCPICGHINEEKAFRSYEDTE